MALISSSVQDVATLLQQNQIAAIPTETVYGLAGNAYNETALKKIFELKQRPFYNPLIVHIKSVKDLNLVAAHVPAQAQLLAAAFWPGPLTLVLKKQAHIPDLVTAGKDTVAVRVPNHPVTLSLLEQLDFPLAAPSANPFGSISPTKAVHVANYFAGSSLTILEGGECSNGIESTIIGFENDLAVLYRLGSITIEAIENVIGPLQIKTQSEATPTAPGMISKHYAPKTATILSDNILESLHVNATKRIDLLTFKNRFEHQSIVAQQVLSPNGDLAEAATHLYHALHELDQLDLDLIITEQFPKHNLGRTINDRLKRATKK
ncbi:L-threonylcarbamoyladenylate synthase [Flavobacterium muglaense]|uniref:Threonylcarbamoyl-AMP synthase n=1 Tax=Flavobacterium muglaense TaxID=2764716 RepID=A0A923N1G2_9FLAO|nr:L-threonylcarbamoyladenylate synthase [Flavobacterium muglaense]MBC5838421.1 threonylcarbamoyl-AMP synthase [Flavobacterium muglaense]MBC5845025.1 threonylcarbamoyl-AMP synthase [Flavobacterium muglaense]